MLRTTNTITKIIVPFTSRSFRVRTTSKMQSGLWDAVKSVTSKAQQEGWLFSIKTKPEHMQNSGVKFLLRIASSLTAKPSGDLGKENEKKDNTPKSADPFENPSTKELFVKELTPTHSLMLNKFNVSDYHVLIVTNEFRHQSEPLNEADFESMRLVIEEMNGIGFYNAGEMSGASQPHKHMQVIPLGTDEKLPVDDIIEKSKAPKDTVHVIPDLPYVNRCCIFSDFSAKYLREVYEKVMHEVFEDLRKTTNDESLTLEKMSYNFLMTRKWMMIVPRRMPEYEGLSINSLGMVGWFFVKNDMQLNTLKNAGPMNVLQSVAYAKQNSSL